MRFPGIFGVALGVGIFVATWCVVRWRTPADAYDFEPKEGFFERILPIYLDIAKFIMGLAAGGIVLIVGSSAVRSTGRLPVFYAAPLFLLAMSIFYGSLLMPLLVSDYEAFRHGTHTYSGPRYVRNQALGYSSIACFCLGYGWLIWAAVAG